MPIIHNPNNQKTSFEQALGNRGKEKLPFKRKKPFGRSRFWEGTHLPWPVLVDRYILPREKTALAEVCSLRMLPGITYTLLQYASKVLLGLDVYSQNNFDNVNLFWDHDYLSLLFTDFVEEMFSLHLQYITLLSH